MKCFPVRLSLALAALTLALTAGPATAQGTKSSDVVKVTASAARPDAEGRQTVTLTFDIQKPWHIYANPVGNEDLKAVQTRVKVDSKVEKAKFDFPAGKDARTGDIAYKVYEGKVTIKGQVQRAKGDTKPLTLSIRFQACDDKRCLLPATVKVTPK
jgi:uncharacterized protein